MEQPERTDERKDDSDQLNDLVHKHLVEQPENQRHTSYGIGGAGNMRMNSRIQNCVEKLIIMHRTEIGDRSCRRDSEKQSTKWSVSCTAWCDR